MPSALIPRSFIPLMFFVTLGVLGEYLHLRFYGFVGDAELHAFAADWCGVVLVAIAIVGLFYSAACAVSAKIGSRCQVQFWGFIGGLIALAFVAYA